MRCARSCRPRPRGLPAPVAAATRPESREPKGGPTRARPWWRRGAGSPPGDDLGFHRGSFVYLGHDVLGPRRAIASHAPLGAAPDFETGSHRRATGRSGQPDAERLYLRQIARSTLLTREGEVELATRIEEGEREI